LHNDQAYREHLLKLLSIFDKNYEKAALSYGTKLKAAFIPRMPALFRRWFYAPLIEQTNLSPANLVCLLNAEFEKPSGGAPQIRVAPAGSSSAGFSYETVLYGLENHPIVEDAKKIVERCYPAVNVGENGFADEKYSRGLAVRDGAYAGFLISAAINCGLFKKMPSLYANVYQPVKNADDFFNRDGAEILDDFVGATLDNLTYDISEFLPVGGDFRKSAFDLLLKSSGADEIYDKLFAPFGLRASDMFEFDFTELIKLGENKTGDNFLGGDAARQAVLTGAFLAGMSLEKNFFTPFSSYFQFIRPLYVMPPDMRDDLKLLEAALRAKDDGADMAMYVPCSFYALTPLGAEYAGRINKRQNKRARLNVAGASGSGEDDGARFEPPNLTGDDLFKLIDAFSQIFGERGAPFRRAPIARVPSNVKALDGRAVVYRIKIKKARDKRYWQIIECYDATTINELHKIICHAFDMDERLRYGFYPEWTDVKKSGLLTDVKRGDAALRFFWNDSQTKFTYVLYNETAAGGGKFNGKDAPIEFELEIVGAAPPEQNASYPRTVKMSKMHEDYLKSK